MRYLHLTYISPLIYCVLPQYLHYAKKIILGISNICLFLFFPPVSISNQNPSKSTASYIFVFLTIASIIHPAAPLSAAEITEDDWQNNAQRVLQLTQEIDSRTASSSTYANADRTKLTEKLQALKAHLSTTEKKLSTARAQLTQISANRAQLADTYQQEMADMKTVEGIFRTALRKTMVQFSKSPVTSQHPERFVQIERLTTEEFFFGIQDMQKYSDLLFADIRDTGRTESSTAQVINLEGRSVEQLLYRAGGFFLGYLNGDKGIFALPQGTLPPTSLLGSKRASKTLSSWISGQSEILPIDITGGTAFDAIQQEQGIDEWVKAGGVLLYPIIIAGLIGGLVALFKTIYLFNQKKLSTKLREELSLLVNTASPEGGFTAKLGHSPAARVMYACLQSKDKGLDAIDSSMEEAILREQSRLERFLSAVGVLASISPLLGLLGTVTGMIDTFQAITIYGTGDPRMMSTGISEALITTQAGLGVALPLLLAHHFLKRRVATLIADMEEAGWGITALLSDRSKGRQ